MQNTMLDSTISSNPQELSDDSASSAIKLFENPQFRVRVIMRCSDPWFVAKDACDCLELGNVSQTCSRLDEDERGIVLTDTPSGKQEMLVVSEPGLYSLIGSSKKQEAKDIKDPRSTWWCLADAGNAIGASRSGSLLGLLHRRERDSRIFTNAEIIFDDFGSKDTLLLNNRGQSFVSLSGFLEVLSKTELSSDKIDDFQEEIFGNNRLDDALKEKGVTASHAFFSMAKFRPSQIASRLSSDFSDSESCS